MSAPDISALLPPSLNLPTHLSAHKYFFVCTLTVAAWDTLVLSPRSWRLLKTKEWPVLKIIFHLLRVLMPAEFIIVGQFYLLHIFLFLGAKFPYPAVAFFDTKFSLDMCNKFYLFEPVTTMILVSLCSTVHVVRVHAIYDKSRAVLGGLGAVLLFQVSLPPSAPRVALSITCCLVSSYPAPILILRSTLKLCLSVSVSVSVSLPSPTLPVALPCVALFACSHFLFSTISFP